MVEIVVLGDVPRRQYLAPNGACTYDTKTYSNALALLERRVGQGNDSGAGNSPGCRSRHEGYDAILRPVHHTAFEIPQATLYVKGYGSGTLERCVHFEDMVWRRQHDVSRSLGIRQDYVLQHIGHLRDVGHLNAVGMLVEGVQCYRGILRQGRQRDGTGKECRECAFLWNED